MDTSFICKLGPPSLELTIDVADDKIDELSRRDLTVKNM